MGMETNMRAAIFDLDGTLAETAPDLLGAANDLAQAHGLTPLLPVVNHRLIAGQGGKALLRALRVNSAKPADESWVDAMFPEFLDAYEDRIDRESTLYSDVEKTLADLERRGWRLAVCTNKPERLARILLDRLGIAAAFPAIIGADTLPVRKPEPEPVWAAIEGCGGARDRAVMIGDSATDRNAARAAGAACALASFGYAEEPVSELAPEAVFHAYSELPALLEEMVAR